MTNLKIGDQAPDFSLPADTTTDPNASFTLSSMRGNPVVIYFYPKDDTSGCTKEAIDFTQLKPQFDKLNTHIIGISPDSTAKHQKFRTKHELEITLVADEERSALEAYGVWVEKSMYGRKYMGVERTTFLIDAEGKIAQIWPRVKVTGHAQKVLEAVQALQAS